MVGVFKSISMELLDGFNYVMGLIPRSYQAYFLFSIAIIGISLYSIFVWQFYRFLAKRDLIELDLKKYNRAENPTLYKFFALLLFILEYAIILPFITSFWFFVMAFILFFLARDLAPENILLIAGGIIGAIRISAYYKEDLSKDLAKMFPFTILAIALVTPGFFKIEESISKLANINEMMVNVAAYLLIIVALEFALRLLYLVSPQSENKQPNETISATK